MKEKEINTAGILMGLEHIDDIKKILEANNIGHITYFPGIDTNNQAAEEHWHYIINNR